MPGEPVTARRTISPVRLMLYAMVVAGFAFSVATGSGQPASRIVVVLVAWLTAMTGATHLALHGRGAPAVMAALVGLIIAAVSLLYVGGGGAVLCVVSTAYVLATMFRLLRGRDTAGQ